MVNNKKRKKLILGIALLIAAGFAIKLFFGSPDFRYSGTLEATKIDLSAQIPSTIHSVKVYEGDHIGLNQSLVSLSCEDIHVAHALAAANYDRNAKLFKSGAASKEVFDQVKNRKDDADVRLKWCEIYSPIQGTVLSRYHEPGEWVNPGTKLLTLANIQDIWAYIYVPQPLVSRLKPGMVLMGFVPELDNKKFQGKIIKINEEAEFTPKNVQTRSERQRLIFGVKVSFLGVNQDEVLKPGMTIEIELPKEIQK